MKQRSIIADILLLCVSFIWGTTFVLVQNAVDTFPPFSFLTIRFLIASILLYFVIQLLPTKKLYLTKSLLLHGCIIGTAIFIWFFISNLWITLYVFK
ncbi:EamA family transporter [Bacillus coahuilensis]|uniref:EamA family transporter n=1 Tax=Bacillus coahuilensis TaxID=408580 RepID=UPI0009D75C53